MAKSAKKAASKKKAAGKKPSEPRIVPAMYAAMYEAYPADFSSQYFSAARVIPSVKNIKAAGFTRDNLLWGYYQKFAPSDPADPANWGTSGLYENWEAAIAEARDDLKKVPVDANQPGPDPDNPGVRARNMLEHLDIAVKIALFDKHQLGHPDESGIEVEILVRTALQPSRRHNIRTIWRPTGGNPPDAKYCYDKLTIVMTCPRGGWIGTAAWKYTGPSRFTEYTANYRVPPPPDRDVGQIIFIFNGLESLPKPQQSYPPAILQPVLQWTSGDGWAIRSWYVPSTYTPTFDMMPGLNDERPFADPAKPAWTKAEKVATRTLLKSVIKWDLQAYRSRFMIGTTPKVELFVPNILPLTYPVAAIEGYRIAGRRTLVDVTMNNIALNREDAGNVPVEPTWDIPSETDSGDGIHHGTGRLQRYRIVPSANNSTVTFTRK